jgi:hypothetical protein
LPNWANPASKTQKLFFLPLVFLSPARQAPFQDEHSSRSSGISGSHDPS